MNNQNKLDEELVQLCELGYLDDIQKCVDAGADIHTRDNLPLYFAINRGHVDVVKYLVERGVDVFGSGGDNLRDAVKSNNLEMVKCIFKNDINDKIKSGKLRHQDYVTGEELLELAFYNKNVEMVQYLLEKGLEIDIYFPNNSIINTASRYGTKELLEVLIKLGVNIKTNHKLLWNAATFENVEILKELIRLEVDLNSQEGSAIYGACRNNEGIECIDLLVKHGAHLSPYNHELIKSAAYNGSLEVVKYLILEHNCDPEQAIFSANRSKKTEKAIEIITWCEQYIQSKKLNDKLNNELPELINTMKTSRKKI